MHARKRDLNTLKPNAGILDDVVMVEGTQLNPIPPKRKVHTLARAWAHMWGKQTKNEDDSTKNG